MKLVVSTVVSLALAASASAVTTQDLNSRTPQQLAQTFVGSGVTISNVQYTGANVAAGTFTGGVADGIGIESGVILSTGNIADAAGPNVADDTSTSNLQPGDASLQALLPATQTSEDATVLEFDFVPTSNRLVFRYVFASEEYNEFVGQDYNDIFAFFLNGQNIALIPNTTQPVSIDSVNLTSNPSLYRNNDPGDLPTPPYLTEYDGFTVVLTAQATVTPGVTHHIKLAISDVNDQVLDSAVFFEAASFAAPCNISVTATDADASEAGSGTGTFTITRTGPTTDPLTVNYTVGGTATNGTDYTALTGTATIPAGSASTTVTVTPTDDAAVEGNETVTITLTAGACGPVAPTSATVTIADNDLAGCSVTISATDATATETGPTTATFTVTRSGSTAAPATITYTVGGTATSGTDYTPLTGSVTIPAGQTSATITVTPIDDAALEGTESVVITLTGGACTVGATGTANATIIDNEGAVAASDVPTLSEWALIALSAMLGLAALFAMKK